MIAKTFECLSDGEAMNDSVVSIIIAKEPKTPNCGSYLNNGKDSLPTVWMLIKHIQSGYTFSTEAIHKGKDFEHHVFLQTRYRKDVLPEIKAGDTFIGGGFVVNEGEYPLTKDDLYMSEEAVITEIEKCYNDPVYFYNTYWMLKDGSKPKPITQEEWDHYQN